MLTTLSITLTHIACCRCGIVFGIEQSRIDRLRETHEDFYCPSGHVQGFYGPNEKERKIAALERETKALITSRDFWAEQTRTANVRTEEVKRSLRGTKAVVTRMKRRTAKGRCPCCSHQFKDLERHMKTRHPKWEPENGAEGLAAQARYAQGESNG